MSQTSFTLLGFTQPQTALPIIHNAENNAKGFTSRILWYFPNPIFRRLAESELTEEEKDACEQWEQNLGNCIFLHIHIITLNLGRRNRGGGKGVNAPQVFRRHKNALFRVAKCRLHSLKMSFRLHFWVRHIAKQRLWVFVWLLECGTVKQWQMTHSLPANWAF